MSSKLKFFISIFFSALLSPSYASLVFTTPAYFINFNNPQVQGAGTYAFEQAPLGSGVHLSAPNSSADGIRTAQDYIFLYTSSIQDIGSAVYFGWVADRDYTSSGSALTPKISTNFTISLTNSNGGSALILYEAQTTGSIHIGPGTSALAYDPNYTFTLDGANNSRSVARTVYGTPFSYAGSSVLRQNFGIWFSPTHAGQEFRLTFSPTAPGVDSTIFEGTAYLSEPPTLTLFIFLIMALSAHSSLRKYLNKNNINPHPHRSIPPKLMTDFRDYIFSFPHRRCLMAFKTQTTCYRID